MLIAITSVWSSFLSTSLFASVLQTSPSQMSSSSSSSSLPSLDTSMSSSNTNTSAANSTTSRMLTVPGQSPMSKPQHDFYIIRVTVETSSVETDGRYSYHYDHWPLHEERENICKVGIQDFA